MAVPWSCLRAVLREMGGLGKGARTPRAVGLSLWFSLLCEERARLEASERSESEAQTRKQIEMLLRGYAPRTEGGAQIALGRRRG